MGNNICLRRADKEEVYKEDLECAGSSKIAFINGGGEEFHLRLKAGQKDSLSNACIPYSL